MRNLVLVVPTLFAATLGAAAPVEGIRIDHKLTIEKCGGCHKTDENGMMGRLSFIRAVRSTFTPGWEVDNSGGTAGLCQPVERDLFDCYLGCGWPAQVPDHLNNSPDWSDKCSSAANDWRKVDVVFP